MSNKKACISKVLLNGIKSTFGQGPLWLTKLINKVIGFQDFSFLFKEMLVNLINMMEIDWKKNVS